MQAPQTPCSQPTWGAGETEVVAQGVDEVRPGRDVDGHLPVVEDERDLVSVTGGRRQAVTRPGCASTTFLTALKYRK